MAWIVACKNKLPQEARDELLKIVDDLSPLSPLPVFPDELGTPAEFLERWRGHEIDVRFVHVNGVPTFEIWHETLPPDEPEDLDEAGEPAGHWEGLTWIADPPKKSAPKIPHLSSHERTLNQGQFIFVPLTAFSYLAFW
jgi:hypothetical protein